MMKSSKIIVVIILLSVLFRGFIYRTLVNYSEIGKRVNIELKNKKLIQTINNKIKGKELNLSDIINISNKITSKQLSFTSSKVSSNPNKIFNTKKANCIGYSSLFNSIGNYIINKKNLTKKYEFSHLVGKLEFLGYNIHHLFNNPFFSNHDYNEIKIKETSEKKFIDPSLRDYVRIEYVSSK